MDIFQISLYNFLPFWPRPLLSVSFHFPEKEPLSLRLTLLGAYRRTILYTSLSLQRIFFSTYRSVLWNQTENVWRYREQGNKGIYMFKHFTCLKIIICKRKIWHKSYIGWIIEVQYVYSETCVLQPPSFTTTCRLWPQFKVPMQHFTLNRDRSECF